MIAQFYFFEIHGNCVNTPLFNETFKWFQIMMLITTFITFNLISSTLNVIYQNNKVIIRDKT